METQGNRTGASSLSSAAILETLLGLGTEELCHLAEKEGQPAYRGKQIADWVYRRGARHFDDMVNIPSELRIRLGTTHRVGRSEILATQKASDGTFKLLLGLEDGATMETVGLPYSDRFSCCVSTQVGCTLGCLFCATGMSGFSRNLTSGEIVDQVLAVREAAAASVQPADLAGRVDHVTFMGMGEPLLNYGAVLEALHLLNHELGISARNLTLSTAGVVPGILMLAREKLQITLAVSLHAPNDELRWLLMPGMTRWPVTELVAACREYVSLTGRRVTFEYCLIDGVNDRDPEAAQLAGLLRGLNCHVNLIPLNRVAAKGMKPSSPARIQAFRGVLSHSGIQVTQRKARGAGIDAACGQLRRRHSLP